MQRGWVREGGGSRRRGAACPHLLRAANLLLEARLHLGLLGSQRVVLGPVGPQLL